MLRLTRDVAGGRAVMCFTDRHDGDLAVGGDPADLAVRRRSLTGAPWVWLEQVHGDRVHEVEATTEQVTGRPGDALVTSAEHLHLAVQTADCVPLALIEPSGRLGAVHAGWRGLAEGVVERTVEALTEAPGDLTAVVGPCIHVECYEFGADALAALVGRWGSAIAGTTTAGRPALDMVGAVTQVLRTAGVTDIVVVDHCTSCDQRYFSHRARGESGRQALVVWREPVAGVSADA